MQFHEARWVKGWRLTVGRKVYRVYSLYMLDESDVVHLLEEDYVRYMKNWVPLSEFMRDRGLTVHSSLPF